MTTLLVTHPIFLEHEVPQGHPERPDRLRAIARALSASEFGDLRRAEAREGTLAQITTCHPEHYIDELRRLTPRHGLFAIDADTAISPRSLEAAFHGVGGTCMAVDAVMAGEVQNAFVAMRPPGHHAEPDRAMGFCLFGNAAIAARHAQRQHGAGRVAIVDWDVHHGNGTQAIVWDDPSILYASTHQSPLYPGTGSPAERGAGNIINVPLPAGTASDSYRSAFASRILPAVDAAAPDLIVISAGFDAHERDPLAGLRLVEDDFAWATGELMALADKHAEGRIVSVLEGGYDLQALAASVAAHVRTLARP